MNLFERINEWIRDSEASLVNLLSAIAPWGAPLAPAFMSYGGMVRHLGYTPFVAFIIAGVIEILGLATVHTTLTFWKYNKRYSREEKKMPTRLAAGMFLLYLVIILTTNVVLELPIQEWYIPIIARALLSLLAVPASITLAVRTLHTEAINDQKQKVTGKKGKEQESSRKVTDWRKLPAEDRELIKKMNTPEIVKQYAVSERTARNWRKNG
jgi:protein-S-isoprenylcysteine O-methyltransferase Ste14